MPTQFKRRLQASNWLFPKTNEGICFSIQTVRKYLKLEFRDSSFKYFRIVRIKKQIRPFVFWEKLWLEVLNVGNFLSKSRERRRGGDRSMSARYGDCPEFAPA